MPAEPTQGSMGDKTIEVTYDEDKVREAIRDVRRAFLKAIMDLTPRGLGVLVVDDEPDIREAVYDLMKTELDGAHVFAAESGEEALQVLHREKVDLILTDYKMPGMNGVKFLEEVDKFAPGIPHIILTAFDRELIRELGSGAGREHIIPKPFEPETLLSLVEAALSHNTQTRAIEI